MLFVMEPEVSQSEVQTKKSVLTQVTPLSKYLAMIIFVIMPFIGGWVGHKYAPVKVVEIERFVEIEKEDINNKTTTSVLGMEEGESVWRGYQSEEFYGFIHDPRSDEEGRHYIDFVEYKNGQQLATTSFEVRRDAVVFYSMWTTCNTLYSLGGGGNSLMSLDWVPEDNKGIRPTCLDTYKDTDKVMIEEYPYLYKITVDDSGTVVQIYQPYHP
jgi:hypothetical protein